MTVGECKRKVLMLLDMYTVRGTEINDEDIKKKLPDYIDAGQKAIAQICHIEREYTVLQETGRTRYTMPEDFIRPLRIRVNGVVSAVGDWIGNVFFLPETAGEVTVEYYAAPETVTAHTDDATELQLRRDAQELVPYWAAINFLSLDLVYDSSRLQAIYDRMLINLETGPVIKARTVNLGGGGSL